MDTAANLNALRTRGVDINGNGQSNSADVAFGNNPAEAGAEFNMPQPILGSLIIEFPLDERLQEISYTVEGSEGLGTWFGGRRIIRWGPTKAICAWRAMAQN